MWKMLLLKRNPSHQWVLLDDQPVLLEYQVLLQIVKYKNISSTKLLSGTLDATFHLILIMKMWNCSGV